METGLITVRLSWTLVDCLHTNVKYGIEDI